MEEGSRSCTGDVRLTKRSPVLQPGRGGGASIGGVDGSRGGDSGGGRGRDLHVNKSVGDVVDAVVRDSGRVRLVRVHVASRGRAEDVRRVVTLPS
jgi:hypothetical protein